ncbi:tyrosine-type recombinase/integrase [Fusobacterium hominis]|uniref:Site-specific integrase n=1 Tax=Fusobacterium hominis TaxID=2764326 RepID=A0A7G9GYC7_9FUSO|nr:tyrosine-type recombinase/integrase [Fusobacterium hominis]QNM15809.1 site-specific integrase [Fusobacterium hominis]
MQEKIDIKNYLLPGRLRKKDGYWHVRIDAANPLTKEKIRHSQSTKIRVEGKNKTETKENERRAGVILSDFRKKWSNYYFNEEKENNQEILFVDYLRDWLYSVKGEVEPYTFKNYRMIVEKKVVPYFEPQKLLLGELKARHIQEFYTYCLNEQKLNPNTVIRYHANIRKALQRPLKQELVSSNQADLVDKPKKKKFIAKVLSPSEIQKIFNEIKGTHLLWSSIDFDKEILEINNTVVEGEEGKVYNRLGTKTKSSHRFLPLIPEVKVFLKNLKEEQEKNKKYFKNSYNQEFLDNVCVKENGDIIKPDYVTQAFTKIARKLGFENFTFHGLRHSFATNLYLGGVDLNTLKELLGHSYLNTTAEVYTHLPREKVIEIGKEYISMIMKSIKKDEIKNKKITYINSNQPVSKILK